jgi:hypothetical protein
MGLYSYACLRCWFLAWVPVYDVDGALIGLGHDSLVMMSRDQILNLFFETSQAMQWMRSWQDWLDWLEGDWVQPLCLRNPCLAWAAGD